MDSFVYLKWHLNVNVPSKVASFIEVFEEKGKFVYLLMITFVL